MKDLRCKHCGRAIGFIELSSDRGDNWQTLRREKINTYHGNDILCGYCVNDLYRKGEGAEEGKCAAQVIMGAPNIIWYSGLPTSFIPKYGITRFITKRIKPRN